VSGGDELRISDVDLGDRGSLEPILEESFEGWYLQHSRKTLLEIGKVRAAEADGKAVGLAMLKTLADGVGYVYYIAVAKAYRRKGFGGRLLDDALTYFAGLGDRIVYSSVENEEAKSLFASRGFRRTDFGAVRGRFGLLRALSMYRSMLAVPGEVLLELELDRSEEEATPSSHA
jgi:ribosomal protein S18 acetylase RimI-like enzyme